MIFAVSSSRLSASIGISSSSLGRAMTAASYFLTSGRICSIRSSSAVIELTSARPWYADEPGLERLDDRGVDADRQVGELLDHRDRLGEQLGLVGQRDAHVDVEHVGAALDLGLDVALDRGQVAGAQLLLEDPAAGGVDPLADQAEAACRGRCTTSWVAERSTVSSGVASAARSCGDLGALARGAAPWPA